MKRLFVFGCSYTSWNWPTWADLYAQEFDYYENWGLPGLGNRAIAERVAECNFKNKFTEDDTVVIQWSSHLRHDWLKFTEDDHESWKTKGSIFNYHNVEKFSKHFLDTFFDEKAYFLHTLNNILLTTGLLKSTKCKFFMTSISKLNTLGSDIPHQDGHGENIRNNPKLSNAWEEFGLQEYSKIFEEDHWLQPIGLHGWNRPDLSWWFTDDSNNKWVELHPSPQQHLSWLQSNLSQELTDEQQNMIDTVVDCKTNDYIETIKTITSMQIANWDRSYRGL